VAERLRHEVEKMNINNFIVRPKRKLVEKYGDASAWHSLDEGQKSELIDEVAGLIMLKHRPKFCRPRQRYANVRYVRQRGLHMLLPLFGCPLSATRAEPRFARVKHELRFCL